MKKGRKKKHQHLQRPVGATTDLERRIVAGG